MITLHELLFVTLLFTNDFNKVSCMMADPLNKPAKMTLYNDRMNSIWNMPGKESAPKSLKIDTNQDHNECLCSPCVKGTCTNTANSFTCTCTNGWTGKVCDTALGRNTEVDVTDALTTDPYNDNQIKHLIHKFNKHCQNTKDMDSRCAILIRKIMQQTKIQLDLNYDQPRQLQPKMMCLVDNHPISIQRYNPSKQLCCRGIHNKITGSEMCCGNEIYNGMSNENRKIINKSEKLCCDGMLFDKTRPSQECCKTYVYDTTTGVGCCGNKLYDTKYRFCCANGTLHHNIGRHNSHGRCCGAERYDDRCFSCNTTSNKLTIYALFDQETQICCHGRIKTIQGNKTKCCGKRLINEAINTCVENNIVVKQLRMLFAANSTPSLITAYRSMGSEMVSNTSEVNFKKKNERTTSASKNQTWMAIWGILSAGLFLLVFVPSGIFLYKRRTRICKKEERHANVCGLNNAFDQSKSVINNESSYIHKPANSAQDGGCESGYQSIQQPSSYNSELSMDSCGADTIISGIGSNDELSATIENVVDNAMRNHKEITLFEEAVPDVTVRVDKLVQHSDKNFTSELFTNAETQTFPAKETNQRDIFGRPYQYSCYIDQFNRTLQWDKSETKMTLPLSAVTLHPLHVQASSFDDIPAIYKKFCLSKDTRLAGPVVEYCLTGCKTLGEHARVELPVINDGKQKIDVLKFRSDEGMNEIADVEHIPVLEKENAGTDYDAFCIIEREKVLIYTKTFSGFSCIIHGQRENFSLHAFLFGSYKKVMEHQEVRLTLYIADELHKFKDYNQRMFGNEVCEGREKKAEKPLELPDCCLNGDDYLEITGTVIGDVSDTWEHKLHPRENRPIETERKIVKMKNLSRCCQSENALPHQVGWYLINKTQSRPSSVIQCVVDIQCIVMADRALSTHTSLIVDELHLRASDRSEVLTEPEKVFELKKFLIQTPELPIKDSLNHRLNEINQRLFGRSTNENNLQENLSYLENQMNTDDFIRTIVDILKEMKEYKLLDILNQRKYIADRFLNKPVQTCERDIPINPAHGASNRQIVPEVTSPVGANEPDNISRIYCRSEMVGTRSCSFDHRNINTKGGVPVTLVSRPRAELPTAERDDSDTELKTSELQPNLS